MKESESVSHSVMSDSLWSHGLVPTRFLCLWNSPGKNTAVGCHFLLRGPSWPRDQIWVSCIAGRFFTVLVSGKPKKPWTRALSFQAFIEISLGIDVWLDSVLKTMCESYVSFFQS